MLVLPIGLDKFGHVLDADLKKKSSLVDRFINEIFAFGKFLGFCWGKHQQSSGNTGLCMCE